MEKLEDNSTQMPLVLESEGDDIRLQEHTYENRNQCPKVDEEPTLKARIEEAEKLVTKTSRDKVELINNIRLSQYDWYCARSLLDYHLIKHETWISDCLNLEREKMNILQLFLLHCANKSHPGLSAEGKAKNKLSFRMLHRTKNLAEEKRLLKEINVSQEDSTGSFSSLENDCHMFHKNTWWWAHQARYEHNQRNIVYRLRQIQFPKWRTASRPAILLQRKWDEAIANAIANANVAEVAISEGKICDALRSKRSLREQIKITGAEIDELTQAFSVRSEKEQVEKELKVIEEDLECWEKKLPSIDQREREAYECLLKLRKQQNRH